MSREFKEGDRVWCPSYGWGMVQEDLGTRTFPISVRFDAPEKTVEFTREGKEYNDHPFPMLFHHAPEQWPPTAPTDKLMEVMDTIKNWKDEKDRWPTFQVNDNVWSPFQGWGYVAAIIPERPLPLHVVFNRGRRCEYHVNGVPAVSHGFPMLFHREIKPEEWPRPEPVRLPDLPVDTVVEVRADEKSSWVKRHLSHFEWIAGKAKCLTWVDGRTSHTAVDKSPRVTSWKHWRLPEETKS